MVASDQRPPALGDHLEELTLADHSKGGAQEVVKTNRLFVFVGAAPRTDWLPAEVARDEVHFWRTVDGRIAGLDEFLTVEEAREAATEA